MKIALSFLLPLALLACGDDSSSTGGQGGGTTSTSTTGTATGTGTGTGGGASTTTAATTTSSTGAGGADVESICVAYVGAINGVNTELACGDPAVDPSGCDGFNDDPCATELGRYLACEAAATTAANCTCRTGGGPGAGGFGGGGVGGGSEEAILDCNSDCFEELDAYAACSS